MHHAKQVGTRRLAYKQTHVRTQASLKEGRGSQRNGLGMLVGFVSVEVGTVG